MNEEFLALCQKEMIAWRRHFHAHPELSGKESETEAYIVRQLRKIGFQEIRSGIAGHGVVALLHGKQPGNGVILLRGDIDALPITEKTGCSFSSQNPGVMHACGHDAHAAILLGTARLLHAQADAFGGTVKFCFQPAEEGDVGGAEQMVAEGILENPSVDCAAALHMEPSIPVGAVSLEAGPITAYPDFFTLSYQGRGGHGTLSCQCNDPILAAVRGIGMLQDIHSKISALDSAVVQVCMIHGGEAPAAIPNTAVVQGTVRTFREEDRERIRTMMEGIAKSSALIYGVECQLDYRGRCSPVINDYELTSHVRKSIFPIFEKGFASMKDMGGEDFCFISDRVPSVYLNVGCAGQDERSRVPLHNECFLADEGALLKGACALAQIALDYLNGKYSHCSRA